MTTEVGAPVVVGVDGSEASLAAVRLAVRMAAERDRPLRVVHAFVWPLLRVPLGPAPGAPPDAGLRADAERLVKEAVDLAAGLDSRVEVTGAVVPRAVAAVLVAESVHAALLVIGDRGLGGFAGLLLGSVAAQVAAHARCPVVVARGVMPDADGPVVVGVDGSPTSTLAVAFAAEEAALRDTELVAVHASTGPVSTGPGDMLPLVYDTNLVEADEERLLAEATAGLTERHPDLRITRQVVRGRTRPVLIERSRGAQLMVVGSRGRGGFEGLLLGSVSQALLHHSECPVAVVRPTAEP